MTRSTHDRLNDHFGADLDSNIDLDGATFSYADGEDLHTVIADLDDRVTDAGLSGGLTDLIISNDQDFAASLGSWTASGGTMSRDTTYKIAELSASLKHITTATAQYVELPISGTFTSGRDYYAVLFLSVEETSGTITSDLIFGLIGTDSATRAITINLGGSPPYVGNDRFVAYAVRWRPSADRTGVKVRLARTTAGSTTYTWHIGMARGMESPITPILGSPTGIGSILPVLSNSGVAKLTPSTLNDSGLHITEDGTVSLWGLNNLAGASYSATLGEGSIYAWAEHTPASIADAGFLLQVGSDYVGLYISEKDSSTLQLYPDQANVHDIELVDRTKRWKIVNGAGNVANLTNLMLGTVNVILDGTTGIKADIELGFPGVWTAARLLADQTGSIVVDIWKDTYANFPPTDADSITASAPPTISTNVKSEDTTLTGWTTTFSAGDILRINTDSVTTITRATLSLTFRRT